MRNKINSSVKWLCAALFFTFHSSLFTSCSDEWSDHYEEATTAGGTLWQTIKGDGNLGNFASVLEACGYNTVLDGSQTFTVFAPTNAALSASEAGELIASYRSEQEKGVRTSENSVIRRFIMNHIAQYRYPVSSMTDETILLMNDKYAKLTSDRLGSNALAGKNTLCDNGLLFTMDSKLDYVPNVFEALDMEEGLDSVYSFLSSHNTYEFVEAQSVPGEIIDGMTHYLDSVTVLTNDLLSKYGRIDSEDSTYWFVAPTNAVWEELVEEYTPYFNYPRNVSQRDSMQYTNTRLAIIGGGFFSRTLNSEVAFSDSAVSTQALTSEQRRLLGIADNYYVYRRPFDEGGVFYGTTDIACSNGHVRKATTATLPKLQTFMQTISVEAESTSGQDTLINAIEPMTMVQVASNNKFYGKVSGDSYVEVSPVNPSARVAVGFKIPDVLSGVKYNIYAVFAPATAGDSLAIGETEKSLRVLSRIRQADQNGVISSPPFRYPKSVDGTTVDKVLLQSNVSLTTCSWGLTTPTVRLELQSNTDGATLRIDRIIFEPVGQ